MIGMERVMIGDVPGRTRILWLPIKPAAEMTPVEKAIAREMRRMAKRNFWQARNRRKRLGIDFCQMMAAGWGGSYARLLLKTMVRAGMTGKLDPAAKTKLRGIPEFGAVKELAVELLPRVGERILAEFIKEVQA